MTWHWETHGDVCGTGRDCEQTDSEVGEGQLRHVGREV